MRFSAIFCSDTQNTRPLILHYYLFICFYIFQPLCYCYDSSKKSLLLPSLYQDMAGTESQSECDSEPTDDPTQDHVLEHGIDNISYIEDNQSMNQQNQYDINYKF